MVIVAPVPQSAPLPQIRHTDLLHSLNPPSIVKGIKIGAANC
jgi:hypothetical protein